MQDLQHAASTIAAGILGWDQQPLPADGCCRAYDDLVAMAKEMLRRPHGRVLNPIKHHLLATGRS
jgi:hypothetical protein